MITKEMIKQGIDKEVIEFITDPNMEQGTVCKIGECWFYFGGQTAEDENPEEYLSNMLKEDIINDIWNTLESFKEDDIDMDEYLYYQCYLNEHGIN